MIYEDEAASPRVGNQQNPNHSQLYIQENDSISNPDAYSQKQAAEQYDPVEVQ